MNRSEIKKLRPIMFVGTGSDVGKSVINAAFCRIFLQDGFSPAPFKAQNMSLNSYATSDQLEIGRAQAVQAEACGIPCRVEMNPILLKPTNYTTAQVVLNGKPIGNKSASDYFMKSDREELFREVTDAFDRLAREYSPIVMEGAGSISEVNLWDKDIVNMRMALQAEAATYLVADIDRGGVFASVYGSILLLPEREREAIKGIIINKFRGDIELFREGREMLEQLTGKPVVGVIPYFQDIFIEQEDAVCIENSPSQNKGSVNIGVVLLRHMSNFTDFNTLASIPCVNLFYARTPEELSKADIVLIPGSKNTIADIQYLRKSGMDQAILRHFQENKPLYGICGGFQILGRWVHDPEGIEGECGSVEGLGVFPVETTLDSQKTTRQSRFTFIHGKGEGEGYEIHAGITPTSSPLTRLESGEEEGYYLNDRCWGSYLHGILDNPSVIQSLLQEVGCQEEITVDYRNNKESNYNKLAAHVRAHVDMEYIYQTLER